MKALCRLWLKWTARDRTNILRHFNNGIGLAIDYSFRFDILDLIRLEAIVCFRFAILDVIRI